MIHSDTDRSRYLIKLNTWNILIELDRLSISRYLSRLNTLTNNINKSNDNEFKKRTAYLNLLEIINKPNDLSNKEFRRKLDQRLRWQVLLNYNYLIGSKFKVDNSNFNEKDLKLIIVEIENERLIKFYVCIALKKPNSNIEKKFCKGPLPKVVIQKILNYLEI